MKRITCIALFVILFSSLLAGIGRAEGGPPGLSGGGLANSSAIFTGQNPTDGFGTSTAGVGDVNGDGFDDLLIGAPYEGGRGVSYLYLGSRSGWALDESGGAANAFYFGESSHFGSGASVAGAGDVNGDGYADMLIGAPNDNSNQGLVYLVLGSANPSSAGLEFASAKFFGEPGSSAGFSVAGAGDVNGDGFDDMLIGAPGLITDQGRTYLVLGSANPTTLMLSAANAIYLGENNGDNAGTSVAGAGDVNGDGYADILIGAPGYATGGRAYLVLGSNNPTGLTLFAADGIATGETSAEDFGGSVAGAGDVNGDGFADLLVGAARYNTSQGRASLFLGGQNPIFLSLVSPYATFTGAAAGDKAGSSVAGAGDVNGDGYADLLIGASGDTSSTGWAYLLLGSASPASSNLSAASATYTGEWNDHAAGSSVAGAGDANGDGFADLLVGAPGYNSSQGRAYLVLSDYGAANGGAGGSAAGARYRAVLGSGNQPPFTLGGVTADYSSGDAGSVYITHFGRSTCSQDTTTNGLLWQVESLRGPNAAVTFKFQYNNWQIDGLNEASLKLYTRQRPCQAWMEDFGATLDTNTNLITSSSVTSPYSEYTISTAAPGPSALGVSEWILRPARQPVWTALVLLVLFAAGLVYDWRRRKQPKG